MKNLIYIFLSMFLFLFVNCSRILQIENATTVDLTLALSSQADTASSTVLTLRKGYSVSLKDTGVFPNAKIDSSAKVTVGWIGGDAATPTSSGTAMVSATQKDPLIIYNGVNKYE